MIQVTAAVIIKNGKILLCRRAAGENLAGYWEFPGGKLETGENLKQCLERELFEELGVESTAGEIVGRNIHCYDDGEIELVGIKTELKSEKAVPTVHDMMEWVPVEQIPDFRLAPADIPLGKIVMEKFKK